VVHCLYNGHDAEAPSRRRGEGLGDALGEQEQDRLEEEHGVPPHFYRRPHGCRRP